MRKVKITKAPGSKSLGNRIGNQFERTMRYPLGNAKETYEEPGIEVNNTLKPTTWDNATVEAERGETVVTNFMKDGIPEHYMIGGKPHSQGGTPLNLPENSFIFSKDRKLKIKDPAILNMFGKTSSKGFVPADIAKQYKLNDYRRILADPNSSKLERTTAEKMITDYNKKLGALSLVQESIKGFPDGLPAISMGYLENMGIDPSQLVSSQGAPEGQPGQMRLGGTPKNMKSGGSTNKRRVMVRYQTGGTPTKYQNIPEESTKWDVTKDGYDESAVQPGDYVKEKDGKWYLASGTVDKDYGYKDDRLGNLQPAYGHLQNTITTDPALQDAIYANYKNHIENGQLSKDQKERLLALPKEQVINTFLMGQKQVYAINSSGALYQKNEDGTLKRNPDGSPILQSEKDLKKWETKNSEVYNQTMRDLGFTDDEIFSPETTAVFQAAYRGLEDASNDPAFAETLSNFNVKPVGLKDSHGKHTYDNQPISPVDMFFGNTTAGQAVLPKELDKSLTTKEVDWTSDDADPEIAGIDDTRPPQDAPWWLQDIIATAGSAGDLMRIKKHSPWQATPDVNVPNPTFLDPTRQLAANAELANIGMQGASAFAGAQAFNARASQIQGQAAANAANILGNVENQNVGIANQFELNRSQIMNQASANKANLATQLYDKNTIANQQFDNSKAQARQMLRQNYINAITNRAQTQTLNELYPQYNVDPSVGGFMNFTEGRDMKASNQNNKSLNDLFREYKQLNPSVKDEVIYNMAAKDMGLLNNDELGVDPAYYANYANGLPGNK